MMWYLGCKKFRPSAFGEFLATLPEHLQILALEAIKEEHERFERKDFTEEEKMFFKFASDCGLAAAKTAESIAIRSLGRL